MQKEFDSHIFNPFSLRFRFEIELDLSSDAERLQKKQQTLNETRELKEKKGTLNFNNSNNNNNMIE
jgi:hypothetical protein